MPAGQRLFEVLELDGCCAVVEVRGDDDLVSPDEHLVHEVLEELLASLGRVDGRLGEAPVERANACLVLEQGRLDVLSLDGGVKFMLLLFQGTHGLGGGVVENALGDGLDEVGELGLHVCPTGFKCLEDLVAAPVCLLVVVGEVHSE
ncbi:hypothetical protein [Schaalia sp. Marseille-Q2122]|uniref:hypothetical protein n=1 Tax=Schaalia sp. Marseille-Q2122 TaxID=2736604 RepID=UPI00158B3833|nr:hypothetical protein [Schaalia sp. Marseille-Q2122]